LSFVVGNCNGSANAVSTRVPLPSAGDVRRRGLLISIAAILLTIAGLYLTIRMIERK
jgi:hypothetical protein